MIPKECKRLAEVDFPIAVVSEHSESSGRLGHPSTLHPWWARRPLAACRAMLLALLLPDPCDEHCPGDFKEKARQLLVKTEPTVGPTDKDLREALLHFIGDFSDWDNSSDPKYLEVGRGMVKAAHPDETPLVVDPFAGGGSIPLEALRLGCESFASDLNPVSCLMLRVLLEDIPRHGPKLIEELRRTGAKIAKDAEKGLAELYPSDPDGAMPIAYLWARTVRCEAPNCGAEIPLIRSFWLCKKQHHKRAIRYRAMRGGRQSPRIEFEVFEPKSDKEVPGATVTSAKATCICCGEVLAPARVRSQLSDQHGGADVRFDSRGNRIGGARMMAVVTHHPDEQGRHYRLPTEKDYKSVWKAHKRLQIVLDEWEHTDRKGLCPIPDEPISLNEIRRVSVPLYGASTWGDIFTKRQKMCLHTYAHMIRNAAATESCSRLLSLAIDRLLILLSAHCRWKPTGESLIDMFGRHAIGMVWDFAESAPGSGKDSIFASWLDKYSKLVQFIVSLNMNPGYVEQSDATQSHLPDEACQIWFTDPPYYDSIPYAHLSDCFYVWLKRCLPGSTAFSDMLSPKAAECVVDRPHRLSTSRKDNEYFEQKMAEAAAVGRRNLSSSGCASIVFAHKTTEGWEALLSGIVGGNWCITASWPIATELRTRLNARDTASLNTSVHLVCRPRPGDASVGDWEAVFRELPNRVGNWMERLQAEGVRGADLVFACIGPALEIYSKYSKVEDTQGRPIPLGGNPEAVEPHEKGFLAYVWETVGRIALEQVLGTAEAKARNGAAGAVEEDARLTALFLWTLQSTNGKNGKGGQVTDDAEEEVEEPDGEEEETTSRKKTRGFPLVYDVVRRFAQPLGIHLPDWEGRILETKKGVVWLLAVSERAKQLFGDAGASAIADRLEEDREVSPQMLLFPEMQETAVPKVKGRRKKTGESVSDEALKGKHGATTLDRVHAAMLLQASGRANALRALIEAEQHRGPDFIRLANALAALYPKGSEEKRLVEAMLYAVPR